MSRYALEYTDGRVTEITADNDIDAEAAAMDRFGDDAVICESWDQAGANDDGEQNWRKLIWENDDDANNDTGAKAIAQLTVIGGRR